MCGPGMVSGVVIVGLLLSFIVWATSHFGICGLVASICLVGIVGVKVYQSHQNVKKELEDGNHRD